MVAVRRDPQPQPDDPLGGQGPVTCHATEDVHDAGEIPGGRDPLLRVELGGHVIDEANPICPLLGEVEHGDAIADRDGHPRLVIRSAKRPEACHPDEFVVDFVGRVGDLGNEARDRVGWV